VFFGCKINFQKRWCATNFFFCKTLAFWLWKKLTIVVYWKCLV
jgi:hypothetical protein